MRLLCLGDVAPADERVVRSLWENPACGNLAGACGGEEVCVLFNWELPIGGSVNPTPRSSGARLLAHPDAPNVVRRWTPGFACLATNHILDAGAEGLGDTIAALQRLGLRTLGAGYTAEQIEEPAWWTTAEGRLAIVNWVFPETHPDWHQVPGPHCWPGAAAGRTLRALRRSADWVIAVLHWSDELFPYPRPEDRTLAAELAQMGVDVVVGHHPHVVRGMEVVDGCPVFYSIGDFFFSDIPDGHGGWLAQKAPRNREGTGVCVELRRGARPRVEVLSFWQQQERTVPDAGRRGARRMERVSRPLEQYCGPAYDAWYRHERRRFDRWSARWHFGLRRIGVRGAFGRLLQEYRTVAG
jgi:hypothetical protein